MPGSRTRSFLYVLLGLLLAACGDEQRVPLRLAAVGPWHLPYGEASRRGIELALEEINREGGIQGRPLEVLFQNDSASGVRAVMIAQELVADPSVLGVIGNINSGAMIAAAKVYHESLPAVAPTAASPELSDISPWVFRLLSSDSVFVESLALYAATLGDRAAVLFDNNSYGRGGAEVFRRAYPGTLVGVDPIEPGASSIEPHLTYFREQEVDLVYVAGNTVSALEVLGEARRQAYPGVVLGTDSWATIVEEPLAEGTYIGVRFDTTDPRPELARFRELFRARYGAEVELDPFAIFHYDATLLLAQAIAERGPKREAIRAYLAGLNERTAFPGVTGRIHFRSTGDPVAESFSPMRIRGGRLERLDRPAGERP